MTWFFIACTSAHASALETDLPVLTLSDGYRPQIWAPPAPTLAPPAHPVGFVLIRALESIEPASRWAPSRSIVLMPRRDWVFDLLLSSGKGPELGHVLSIYDGIRIDWPASTNQTLP